jgi:hypothetical protein
MKDSFKVRAVSLFPALLTISIYSLLIFDFMFRQTGSNGATGHFGTLANEFIIVVGILMIALFGRGYFLPFALVNDNTISYRSMLGFSWTEKNWDDIEFVSSSKLSRYSVTRISFKKPGKDLTISIYSPNYFDLLELITERVGRSRIDGNTKALAHGNGGRLFRAKMNGQFKVACIGIWVLYIALVLLSLL